MATTSPPRSATSRVPTADWFACWAFSAFFFTVAEICSIEAEVSSRLAACSSVRCDRSVVAEAISLEALVTSRADCLTPAMVVRTCPTIVLNAVTIRPISSRRSIFGSDALKSPPAI